MSALQVGILGGGPAGLYTAILLKLSDPGRRVQVVERNPAGATFGFGVVLSDKTLTAFQQADPVSYAAITAHQTSWGALETIHRGERVRCEGHSYLGIGRRRLLEILGARCEELGVEIFHECEAPGPAIFHGFDLVVAADGVNSLTRSTYADHFEATVERSRSKYIWLGARWTPPAFTFLFLQTMHGLFQAHIYPYDSETSTCIVQCRDETFSRAGLGSLSEAESVTFCQALLAPYTGGAELISNRSLWSTFQTVRTRRWHHGNIVLIGDAAHTAHWSIGSGTKLAMEDAIALTRALDRSFTIPGALAAYQAERQPVVAKIQQAGRISELACENIERALPLDPLPFTFGLMTRAGRLDYEELKRRDPAFIGRIDAYFGGPPALTRLLSPDSLPPVRLDAGDVALARALKAGGCELAHTPDPIASETIRLEAGLATVCPARSLNEAHTLIAGGRADFCYLDAGGGPNA